MGSVKIVAPYYNAGVIAFRDGIGFAESWFNTARKLSFMGDFNIHHTSIDQLSLPITARLLDIDIKKAPQRLNYNIATHAVNDKSNIGLAHYHKFRNLFKDSNRLGLELIYHFKDIFGKETLINFLSYYNEPIGWGKRRFAIPHIIEKELGIPRKPS